jgi:hypothetical protein
MRIEKNRVSQQVQMMVTRLYKDQHLDIPMSGRTRVCQEIERIIGRYTQRMTDIEQEAEKIIIQSDITNDPAAYRRAIVMLAEKNHLPLDHNAINYINRQIQEFLWNSDDVEEIFCEDHVLENCIKTYLESLQI